jgi:hypothetical protein
MLWSVQWIFTDLRDIDGGAWDSPLTQEFDGGLWSDTELLPNYDGGYASDSGYQRDNILVATEKLNFNFSGAYTDIANLFDGRFPLWGSLDGGEVI